MPSLELVEAPPLDAAGHMGLDEAILVLSLAPDLWLRFYRWQDRAVTFGYSQPFALALKLARQRGLASAQIVRRATGGGVVFHDGDLTFSLIFPWQRLSRPLLIYRDIHSSVRLGLQQAGILTRLEAKAKPAGAALARACFGAAAGAMDLVREDGRKVLGGALRRRGGKGLYQGSLRLDVLGAPLEAAREAIALGLGRGFGRFPELEISPLWLEEGRRLALKYRSDRWNRRR